MLPIPITAAESIAKKYGYDQVVVLARRVGEHPEPSGEHITTYGIDKTHCDVAAIMGARLKVIAGWPKEQDRKDLDDLLLALETSGFTHEQRWAGVVRRLIKGD